MARWQSSSWLLVVGIGVFYFKLHSLPEQMAHRGQKVQFEIVAILCLLSLFTHNQLYWVAGLLLAFMPLPDFSTPLTSMAQSLGRMAGARPKTQEAPPADGTVVLLDPEATLGGVTQVPRDDHRPISAHGE